MVKVKRIVTGEALKLADSSSQVDIYINPDWVIAVEPDVMEGTCNIHLTTGWYHVVGDMDTVVRKMRPWFGAKAEE